MRKYIIQDWTGRQVWPESFNTYEDGWDFIFGELTDALDLQEEDYQEYYVMEKKTA